MFVGSMGSLAFLFFIYFALFHANCLEINYNGTEPSLLQLYNIKTGEFLNLKLISDIPSQYVEKKDLGKSRRLTGITESSNLRLLNKKISGETELQVRLGLVRANSVLNVGSDAWKKESKRSVQGYIIVSQETISESVYVCHHNLSRLIVSSFLNPVLFEATHVLVRKEYGMEVSLTISDDNETYEDKQKVTSTVQAAIDVALRGSVATRVDFSQEKKSATSSSSLKVHVKSNIKTGFNVPTTVQEIPQFLEKIPSALNETNGGVGVAMKFVVEDIEIVRKCHNSDYQSNVGASNWERISEHRAKILNDYLQTQDEKTAEVSDWFTDVYDFRKCLPDADLESDGMPLLKFEVQNFTLHFRERLRGIYLNLFSNSEQKESQYDELIASATDDPNSPDNALKLLQNKYGRIKEKLILFRLQEVHGVHCYPVGAQRHLTYTEGFEGFFRYDSENIHDDDMAANLKKFRDFCNKTKSDTKCYIVDCYNTSLSTVCKDFTKQDTVIYGENGKIIDVDLVKAKDKVCLQLAVNQIQSWKRHMKGLRSSGKVAANTENKKKKMTEEFSLLKAVFGSENLGDLYNTDLS